MALPRPPRPMLITAVLLVVLAAAVQPAGCHPDGADGVPTKEGRREADASQIWCAAAAAAEPLPAAECGNCLSQWSDPTVAVVTVATATTLAASAAAAAALHPLKLGYIAETSPVITIVAALTRLRLCDAAAGLLCGAAANQPSCGALLPASVLPDTSEPAPAAGSISISSARSGKLHPALPTAASSARSSSSSSGAGSSSKGGTLVAGILGLAGDVRSLAAVAAAAGALLLTRWWVLVVQRERKRERELPFYTASRAESDDDCSSTATAAAQQAPHGPAPGMPPQPPSPTLLLQQHSRLASEEFLAALLLASPFADVAAELAGAPSSTATADGDVLPSHQLQYRLGRSAGCFFRRLMAGTWSDTAAAAAEMASLGDLPLDAVKALHASHTHRGTSPTTVRASTGSGGGSRSTSGTGSPRGAATPPTLLTSVSSASQAALQWEQSVPLSDWQIMPGEIEIAKRPDGSEWELGVGGFGKVYKALRHGAQPVAVKVLAAVGEAVYQGQEDFKREIAILRACRDPNIVAFMGCSLQTNRTMLVTEYCDGGNLTRNLMGGRVSWHRRGKKIALDVARGLTYLHSRRIIHFDLKSPNILLARDGTAKISDVGMAKIMAREFSGITGNVGTLAWAAPEMLLGARCSEKADVYSFGVVLWEICTCQTPIRGQLRDVRVPQECPSEVRELILDCLSADPRKRPSAGEMGKRLRAMPDPPPQPPTPPSQLASPVRALQQQQQLVDGQAGQQQRAAPGPGALSALDIAAAAAAAAAVAALPAYATLTSGSSAAALAAAVKLAAGGGGLPPLPEEQQLKVHVSGGAPGGGAGDAALVVPSSSFLLAAAAAFQGGAASAAGAGAAATTAAAALHRRAPLTHLRTRASLDDPVRQLAELQGALLQLARPRLGSHRSSTDQQQRRGSASARASLECGSDTSSQQLAAEHHGEQQEQRREQQQEQRDLVKQQLGQQQSLAQERREEQQDLDQRQQQGQHDLDQRQQQGQHDLDQRQQQGQQHLTDQQQEEVEQGQREQQEDRDEMQQQQEEEDQQEEKHQQHQQGLKRQQQEEDQQQQDMESPFGSRSAASFNHSSSAARGAAGPKLASLVELAAAAATAAAAADLQGSGSGTAVAAAATAVAAAAAAAVGETGAAEPFEPAYPASEQQQQLSLSISSCSCPSSSNKPACR